MKLQDQVCTLEQAKKLKELGVIQKSVFFWYLDENLSDGAFWKVGMMLSSTETNYSAFTVAELSIMLLEYAETYFTENGTWKIGVYGTDYNTQAEASADRLINLLRDEILSVNEVNERLA